MSRPNRTCHDSGLSPEPSVTVSVTHGDLRLTSRRAVCRLAGSGTDMVGGGGVLPPSPTAWHRDVTVHWGHFRQMGVMLAGG